MNDKKIDNIEVSIIMPTYNSQEYIVDAIDSIIKQEFQKWELVITDDCSKDSTWSILTKYASMDSRIRIYRLDQNSGAAVARNNSVKYSKAKILAFIDSDDLWYSNKLSEQFSFMRNTDAPISFTSYGLIDRYGLKQRQKIRVSGQVSYKDYLKNTIIGMSTAMINTDITGPISFENIRTRQDTLLWIRLLKRGHVALAIEDELAAYRMRNDSISANKILAVKQVWNVYHNYADLNVLQTTYYMTYYLTNAIWKRIKPSVFS